ncbi:hypothetical protein [Methylocystis sp.]|uniref:hypothetical protein n=1 Tax=Methylocystis sp. TaxID=1911079 RepID=UPI003DA236FD
MTATSAFFTAGSQNVIACALKADFSSSAFEKSMRSIAPVALLSIIPEKLRTDFQTK